VRVIVKKNYLGQNYVVPPLRGIMSDPMSHAWFVLKAKRGLLANMHAKRKRGEKPAKPGHKDYPDKKGWDETVGKHCDCNPKNEHCKACGRPAAHKGESEEIGKSKDGVLSRVGVSGYNKPKKTPSHPKKSHVVVAREGGKTKTIRFGQQGVSGAGAKPKSPKEKARQKSFKARHSKNISRGKMSAAYWADKVKW
tara:strand:+ start:408 stop:992 length:585 start_codon:yes stop_codon:yes gene_type:complete